MEDKLGKRLIFVYNAKSGLGNSILDGAHKILDPKSYSCSLCAITHGAFSEYKRWREFREQSGLSMEFLYKNQFIKQYPGKVSSEIQFPVIFEVDKENFRVVLGKESIDAMEGQESLIRAIKERYNSSGS
ncbi:hypothetical protein [Arenibacter latericius]|uniref:hypothetical protein n=1 Tax=Arenibacter latericius TaxID=86104 RepID=UPI00040E9DB4|nr:hypothetical protein [Arenibacter latericius]MDX1363956.1 GTPase [Arenibacter latericius]